MRRGARSSPEARPAASAPLSVSPAPTVSTASTCGARMAVERRPATSSAPSAPRLTRTARLPPPSSDLAAAAGLPGPASVSSSPRLGVRMSASSSVGRAGGRRPAPGSGSWSRPRAAPGGAPRASPPVRISCPTSTTSSGPSDSRFSARRTWTESSAMFAPPATAMLFSPSRSTRIKRDAGRLVERDEPVEVDRPRPRAPCSRRRRTRRAPTAPMNETSAPSRAAATAALAALAAVVPLVAAADDGLAGAGQPLDGDDQVDVDGPDDDDPAGHDRPTTP